VAWILLNDKKGAVYKILFKQIISLAKARGYQFYPSDIMSDYESGSIYRYVCSSPKNTLSKVLF
jgi:hypothetical protein